MGTMTINVSAQSEGKFRKAAQLSFGNKKGSLGKAVSEAMEMWADQKMNDNEAKMIQLLEKGFKLGKIASRDELHER